MAKTVQLRKFRLTGGAHAQNGRIYYGPRPDKGKPEGDVVASEHDLCKQYTGKFVEVPSGTPVTNSNLRSDVAVQGQDTQPNNSAPATEPLKGQDPGSEPEEQEDGEDGENTGPVGQDVTANFPEAVDQDYKVFKREGQYFVYDADDLSKPIGEGVKKAGVDAQIKAALKSK